MSIQLIRPELDEIDRLGAVRDRLIRTATLMKQASNGELKRRLSCDDHSITQISFWLHLRLAKLFVHIKDSPSAVEHANKARELLKEPENWPAFPGHLVDDGVVGMSYQNSLNEVLERVQTPNEHFKRQCPICKDGQSTMSVASLRSQVSTLWYGIYPLSFQSQATDRAKALHKKLNDREQAVTFFCPRCNEFFISPEVDQFSFYPDTKLNFNFRKSIAKANGKDIVF